MTEFNFGGESPFSEDGSVPPVETSDLKALWKLGQELRLEFPEPAVISVSQPRFTRVCSPGANVLAAWYRAGSLGAIAEHLGMLSPDVPEAIRDVVFSLAARFPMKAMEPGVVYNGLPLDMEEFVKQLERDIGAAQKQ